MSVKTDSILPQLPKARLSDARYKIWSLQRSGKCLIASFSALGCSESYKDFRTNSADLKVSGYAESPLPMSHVLIYHCQPMYP